jgi:hypothetical protein
VFVCVDRVHVVLSCASLSCVPCWDLTHISSFLMSLSQIAGAFPWVASRWQGPLLSAHTRRRSRPPHHYVCIVATDSVVLLWRPVWRAGGIIIVV